MFLLFKVVNEDCSMHFQKSFTITLPAAGIVFAFFEIGRPFMVHCFDCCLVLWVLWWTQSLTNGYKWVKKFHWIAAKGCQIICWNSHLKAAFVLVINGYIIILCTHCTPVLHIHNMVCQKVFVKFFYCFWHSHFNRTSTVWFITCIFSI